MYSRGCSVWISALLVTANVVPSSAIPVTLIMEAIRFPETSVLTRATWCNIPEDGILQLLLLARAFFLPWRWREAIRSSKTEVPTSPTWAPHPRRLHSSSIVQFKGAIDSAPFTECYHSDIKRNSVAFSPQANCTDWVTATCWRNLVQNLWIEWCHVVSAAEPARSLISVFQTGATTFLSSSSSFFLKGPSFA
jgi:hypothetical protein